MDLSTSYTIKAQVTGQNQIAGLKGGLDKLKNSSDNAAGAMARLKGAASQAFGALKALAPAIGIATVGKLVNDTLTLGDQLEKMSQKTGLAVPVLDKLRQAADLGGTDFKTLSRALPTLAKNMQDASDGVGTAKEAFDRLGVSVTNNDGSLKSLDTMFFEIGDKIKGMEDRTLAAANAAEIFGTGMGAKLIPIMNQGSESINALKTSFDQELAERMATFNDNAAQLGERFKILRTELTKLLLGALEKLVETLTILIDKFLNLPQPVQKLIGVIGLISGALLVLSPVIITIVTTIAALVFSFKTIAALKMGVIITKITTAFSGVIAAVKGAALAFAPFMASAAIPLAIIAIGALIFKFREEIAFGFKVVSQKIQEFFSHVADFVGGIFNRISQFISPFVNFVGNVFNSAMNVARDTFNRLPNFVQNAIRIATAPVRGFIKLVQSALDFLSRLMGARKKASSMPSPEGGDSTIPEYNPTSKSIPKYEFPFTSGYEETDFSAGNTGLYKGNTSSGGIPEFPDGMRSPSRSYNIPSRNPNRMETTRLPSGGYKISQRSSKRSQPPNINIRTGNVTQMDGTNYVTTQDLQRAVKSSVSQTMNYLEADGVRYDLGM